MRRFLPLLHCLLAALPLAAAAEPPAGGGLAFGALPLDAEVGAALFRKTWVGGPASTQASDGLGPRYNARSCARCHPGGGAGHPLEDARPGLAAPALVLLFPEGSERYGAQLQTFALPGLPAEGRLTLRYEESELVLTGGEKVTLRRPVYGVEAPAQGPLPSGLRLSPRLAPALAGAALLAALPDGALRDRSGAQGRLALAGRLPERGGRLGWGATAASLAEQAALALHRDLGLGNPLFPHPGGDCGSAQAACAGSGEGRSKAAPAGRSGAPAAGPGQAPPDTPEELEAGQPVLDALLDYLAQLRPAPHAPPAPGQEAFGGQSVFSEIGCAACHRSDLEAAPGLRPFSDLLLHDMGEGLADRDVGGRILPTEWRTAPLWGLTGREGRWLHDGRARTLDEAILWHGGEAAAAAGRYRGLPAQARTMLKTFISGL